ARGMPAAPTTPTATRKQLDIDLPPYEAGRRSTQAEQNQMPGPRTSVSAAPADLSQRPRTLPPLRVVGQIGAMYIVAEGPAGMYLVDQHAAHERILFEQFMLEQAAHPVITQQAFTVTVELSTASARLLEENLGALSG